MNTDPTPTFFKSRPAALVTLIGVLGMLVPGAASAQALGSPIGASAPLGQGPGYHDPRSPFKPLQEREGVLAWSVLSDVKTRAEKNRVVPQFAPQIQSLNNTTVKVQGFMMPLEPGERQKHFLLSAVPATCSFCIPAGPEGLIEVRSKTAVKYTLEPVVMEGTLAVLESDPYGLYYRIADAAPAP